MVLGIWERRAHVHREQLRHARYDLSLEIVGEKQIGADDGNAF